MAMVGREAVTVGPGIRVSVCIANYNGETFLTDCIESVLSQGLEGRVEILIHDDASTDASVAIIRQRFPDAKLVVSDENVGYCVANNRMVDLAQGDYILLLNNDATLQVGALRTLMREAEALQVPAILTLPQYDWESGILVDRGCLLDPFLNPIPNRDSARADVAYVIGACLFLPRDLWRQLGGFPDWFGSIAEDIYLCGVARLRNIPVRCLPESGYRHRQGASFGGNRVGPNGPRTSVNRRRLSERNKMRSLVILTPGPTMWLLLAATGLALAIEGFALSLLRRDATLWEKVYMPALSTPLRERRLLLTARREVQALRTITPAQWFRFTRWRLRKLALLIQHGVPRVD